MLEIHIAMHILQRHIKEYTHHILINCLGQKNRAMIKIIMKYDIIKDFSDTQHKLATNLTKDAFYKGKK